MGFVNRPQAVWWRKALFQVHLWTGIIAGLYLIVACASGSALVFHWEIENLPAPRVEPSTASIDYDFLVRAAELAHPGWLVAGFMTPSGPGGVAQVSLFNESGEYINRFQNPHTGEDLGAIVLHEPLEWLVGLHVELLGGETGRIVNGVGGICLLVMASTGIVVWWPGIRNWRRSLGVKWGSRWKRVNWDLHSAVGFWALAFVLTWAVTGVYFIFPEPFHQALGSLTPLEENELPPAPEPVPGRPFASVNALVKAAEEATPGATTTWVQVPRGDDTQVRIIRHEIYEPWAPHHPSAYVNPYTAEVEGVDISYDKLGDRILRWAGYLHYGNFGGPFWKTLWVCLGLAPAVLAVTGGLM